MNIELLKKLLEAAGVPGREDTVRKIVADELRPFCELSVDAMGNLIARKSPTTQGDEPLRVMVSAHMDEIGFMVRHIDDKGFLRLQPLGGWDPRQMAAQRVLVHAKAKVYEGVLMLGVKPKHMLSSEEMNKPPQFDDYFVDLGLSGDEAKREVSLGDMVTMNRGMQSTGSLLSSKAMDDRVCVFVMIEAMRALKEHSCEIFAVATVQEEVGLRGAAAAGSALAPDVMVGLDITLANDFPGIPETHQVTKLGAGAAIKIMDSSLISHRKVVDHFVEIAQKNQIPYQLEVLPMGGTDPGAVQRLHGGIPSITLSVPTRYVHTVNETVHPDDIEASIRLLTKYLESAHSGNYKYPVER